jgi:hypothetical protein
MWHWLEHWLGMDNLSGPIYGFFSGSGSDIGQVTLVGGVAMMVRKHNCHVHGCWRVGRHPIAGTPYVVCRKHHPDDAPTAQDVAEAHAAAQQTVDQA